jgi:hypothetical protein
MALTWTTILVGLGALIVIPLIVVGLNKRRAYSGWIFFAAVFVLVILISLIRHRYG